MENPGFLKKKYGNLHSSPEVISAANRTEKITQEKFSQNPEKRIQNYLNRFTEILNRKDPEKRQEGIEALRKLLHKNLLIKEEDVNYDYFLKQEQRIAEEQGHGLLRVPDNFNEIKYQEIQKDQKSSLDRWIDYLFSSDAPYPDWAKYWTFRSVSEMGGYNKKEHKFSKRRKDSAQAFPTLNPGCLAEVLGPIQKIQKGEDPSGDLDPKFKELLTTENFSKLYAYALEQFSGLKWENLENTKGYWRTYKQGTEGKILADSLEGYPIEWCTRNTEVAQSQLERGDFHVYYSEDSSGVAKVPRIAIRMESRVRHEESEREDAEEVEEKEVFLMTEHVSGGHTVFENLSDEQKKVLEVDTEEAESIYGSKNKTEQEYFPTKEYFKIDKSQTIGEIRGIESHQNIDDFVQPVLDEKLKEFGEEGEAYLKKSEDMKKVTRIHEMQKLGQGLDSDDLRFIYEIDSKIKGFGYAADPRIKQITETRNQKEDLYTIFNVNENDNLVAIHLIESGETAFREYVHLLSGLNKETALWLIELGRGRQVVNNLKSFKELDPNELVLRLIESDQASSLRGNIKKFNENELDSEVALILVESGLGRDVVNNLKIFKELDQNKLALNLIEFESIFHAQEALEQLKEVDYDKVLQIFLKTPKKFNNSKIVLWFIEIRKIDDILKHVDELQELSPALAQKLFEIGRGEVVIQNFEKFNELDQNKVIIDFLKRHGNRLVVENFKKFNNLDEAVAYELIKESEGVYVVLNNLEKFKELDHTKIALKIIETGEARTLTHHLQNMEILDASVGIELAKKGQEYEVLRNLKKFTKINGQQLIKTILEMGGGRSIPVFFEQLNDVDPSNHRKIVLAVIKNGGAGEVINHLKKFTGLDHNEVALAIIDSLRSRHLSGGHPLIYGLEKFENLGIKVVLKLIEAGEGRGVVQNLEKFTGIHSSDHTPIVLKLLEKGADKLVCHYIEKFTGLDAETKEILRKKCLPGEINNFAHP